VLGRHNGLFALLLVIVVETKETRKLKTGKAEQPVVSSLEGLEGLR
jgi:hypothetical protein